MGWTPMFQPCQHGRADGSQILLHPNLCLLSSANSAYSIHRELIMTFVRRGARRTLL